MGLPAQTELKYRGARILSLSPTERVSQGLPITLKDIGKLLGVSPSTVGEWNKNLSQIRDEMLEDENRKQVAERLEKDKQLRRIAERNLGPQDIAEISEDERLALARKIYQDAMTHGASAKDKDLAVRMLGMLIDRQEVKVGLTGDEIARQHLENRKWLAEHGYGEDKGVG